MGTQDFDDGNKVLTFQVGAGVYGMPLEWVCAVEEREAGGDRATDVYEFRGESLPLVDLVDFFGVPSSPGSSFLILGKGRAVAAAMVDRPGVVFGADEVYKLPELCQNLVNDTFNGVLLKEQQLILMVDPERLCPKSGGAGERSGQGGEGL